MQNTEIQERERTEMPSNKIENLYENENKQKMWKIFFSFLLTLSRAFGVLVA